MAYHVKGRLSGAYCDDCSEDISRLSLYVFQVPQDRASAFPKPKEAQQVLEDKEFARLEPYLLAKGETNEEGAYQLELSNTYDGRATLLLVGRAHTVAGAKADKQYDPVTFSIAYLIPEWTYDDKQHQVADFSYVLPFRFWCLIRSLFGTWVICGKVVDCNTKRPLANVRVTAFDEDWITDDKLGSDVTAADGHFRIYYTTADVRRTFLSPFFNTETPAPYNSGPDVYFSIETTGAEPVTLLREDPSRGRKPDRDNIGPCFCLTLCVDTDPSLPNTDYEPALFTHVGIYDILTGFDAQGFSKVEKNAFTEVIPLKGFLPGGNASNEMEYRFMIADLTAGTLLSPAQVVAAIEPTVIGSVLRRFPHNATVPDSIPGIGYYRTFPFWIKNPGETYNTDPDAAGWIKVPRLNNLDTVGQFQANYSDPGLFGLARINTQTLFNAGERDLTAPTVHVAGNTMNAADRFAGPDQTYRITFEAREAGTAVLSATNTLARIVVWNGQFKQERHPSWSGNTQSLKGVAMLDIAEIMGAGMGCNKITTTVTARHTNYHPYLASAYMIIQGPSGAFGGYNPVVDANHEASGIHVYDFTTQPNCAFILKLWSYYRLDSGFGRRSDAFDSDEIGFCKSPLI
ncbi:MAG: hypothetical protein SF053_08310 [Bacteroidia bacterium]|nr:hypothetical protein [Bacteroidia bacterium]